MSETLEVVSKTKNVHLFLFGYCGIILLRVLIFIVVI
jgi:hypothetical protein